MTLAVTPSFPLERVPTGQLGSVLTPGLWANSGLMALRCLVNTNVVPLPSARTTTLMGWSGRAHAGIIFHDERIVPLLNFSQENSRIGLAREFQTRHAFKVVGQHDAAGGHRQELDAAVHLGHVLRSHRRIAGAKVHGLIDDAFDAASAAYRLVVNLARHRGWRCRI